MAFQSTFKRRSFLLFVIIVILSTDPSAGNESKGPSVMTRKMDVDRQGGLLSAGPLVLGLSSLLFPVLPVLLLAPLAMAGIGPAVNYISESVHGSTSNSIGSPSSQPFRDILNSLSSSSSSSSSKPPTASPSVTPVAAASSVGSVAQALGLTPESASDTSSSGSILSGLSNLFSPERDAPSSLFSSSSLLGSASRPVPSILPPTTASISPTSPTKNKQPSGSSDILGAAASALDNAGLLGPISGAGTGSVTYQLLNLITGRKPSSSPASSSSSPSTLHDLFGSGSSSSIVQASQSNKSPQLGSSFSSNILHSLPPSYNNAVNAASKPSSSSSLTSSSPSLQVSSSHQTPSSSLSSLLGGGNTPESGSFQKLANNALNSITNFIFSKRRSEKEWIPRPYPSFGFVEAASSKGGKEGGNAISTYVKDVVSMLKDGMKRYEIGDSECQSRLVCELHQKAVGRSFKSWLNKMLEVIGVEDYLESTAFGARTKSVMKDMVRAAKNGMSEEDCAITYSKCPVSISVEPVRNSLLNKIVGHTLKMHNSVNHIPSSPSKSSSSSSPSLPTLRPSFPINHPSPSSPRPGGYSHHQSRLNSPIASILHNHRQNKVR